MPAAFFAIQSLAFSRLSSVPALSLQTYERALRVPDAVDTDNIAATFKKGILTVTLPKTAEAQKLVKKIEVKGE